MKENEIFTVENAKVANRKYEIYIRDHGYLKDAEGLVFVQTIRTLVNLKEQHVTTLLRDRNNKEYVRYGDFDLYNTPKDYENGKSIHRTSFRSYELVRKASSKTLCECEWIESDPATEENPGFGYIAVWIFEDGKALQVPVVVNSVFFDENGWQLSDGHLPDKYWESKEDAYGFNEYKIVDEDGEEFIEQGIHKRTFLTPEQWIIVNEMRDLFHKAEEAGIKFLWDRDNCDTVKAMNMQNVADFGNDIMPSYGGQLVLFRDAIFADTEISFYDYNGCDNCDAIALKPTEREKKLWLKEHPESAIK